MSEIKPAGYLTDFGEFKKSVSFCDNAQALYYSTDYEALQKENAELKHINLTSLADLHFKNRDLEDRNAAQAKRIAELEAATEHLGLTPKQAADGLTRYKAQVTEIESLRKQVESVKYFLLTCSSPDCVFTANTLRDQANTLLDQISASKNGE